MLPFMSQGVPRQRKRQTLAVLNALARQNVEFDLVKRDRWTEADIEALPAEEPDIFDRKSGRLFDDQAKFLDALAKALSAFANSGGGSLILGVEDDGSFTGVQSTVGRTSMRDWLEQKIPSLLDYPLSDFRVHTVMKGAPSKIPEDREVVVIDVGDSALAPHQSKRDHIYYQRAGGRSMPAPHFYTELLRQRPSAAELTLRPKAIRLSLAYYLEGITNVELEIDCELENTGRATAYNWALIPQRLIHNGALTAQQISDQFEIDQKKIAVMQGKPDYPSKVILPGCKLDVSIGLGLKFVSINQQFSALVDTIATFLWPSRLVYRLATETSPGTNLEIELKPLVSPFDLALEINQAQTATWSRDHADD